MRSVISCCIAVIMIAGSPAHQMYGNQLRNWKGTPFNEIDSLIKNGGLTAVYILPHLVRIRKGNDEMKVIRTPASIGFIENKEDVSRISEYILNNCVDSGRPQLMGREYKLVLVVKGSTPLVTLRAFDDQGVWFLWYAFFVEGRDAPLVFVKKCDEKFSEFLTSRLVGIGP